MGGEWLGSFMQATREAEDSYYKAMQMRQMQEYAPLMEKMKQYEMEEAKYKAGLAKEKITTERAKGKKESAKYGNEMLSLAKGQGAALSALASKAAQLYDEDPQMAYAIMMGGAQMYGLPMDFENITKEQLIAFSEMGPDPKEFEQAKGEGLDGYAFDRTTGQYFVDPNLRKQLHNTQISDGNKIKLSNLTSINKDITSLTKDARAVKRAADSLAALKESSSPAAKLAAVFAFMKSLDPASVVRETEQGQVYESQGVPAELLGRINNLTGKGRLTGEAFQDLVNTSKVMANSMIKTTRSEVGSYLDVFSGLTQEQRYSLDKRVPGLYEVASIAEPTVQDAAVRSLKAMFDGMSETEKQKALAQMTDAEKEAIGYMKPTLRGRNRPR